MTTGQPPYADQDGMAAMYLISRQKPPRLEGPQYSAILKEFLTLCLNERFEERPGADELSKTRFIRACKNVPTSILRDLIVKYQHWKDKGNVRRSLAVSPDDNDVKNGPMGAQVGIDTEDGPADDNDNDIRGGWDFDVEDYQLSENKTTETLLPNLKSGRQRSETLTLTKSANDATAVFRENLEFHDEADSETLKRPGSAPSKPIDASTISSDESHPLLKLFSKETDPAPSSMLDIDSNMIHLPGDSIASPIRASSSPIEIEIPTLEAMSNLVSAAAAAHPPDPTPKVTNRLFRSNSTARSMHSQHMPPPLPNVPTPNLPPPTSSAPTSANSSPTHVRSPSPKEMHLQQSPQSSLPPSAPSSSPTPVIPPVSSPLPPILAAGQPAQPSSLAPSSVSAPPQVSIPAALLPRGVSPKRTPLSQQAAVHPVSPSKAGKPSLVRQPNLQIPIPPPSPMYWNPALPQSPMQQHKVAGGTNGFFGGGGGGGVATENLGSNGWQSVPVVANHELFPSMPDLNVLTVLTESQVTTRDQVVDELCKVLETLDVGLEVLDAGFKVLREEKTEYR